MKKRNNPKVEAMKERYLNVQRLLKEDTDEVMDDGIRIKPKPCYNDSGKVIPCPPAPTVLEKLSALNIVNDISTLNSSIQEIESALSKIKCKKTNTTVGSEEDKINMVDPSGRDTDEVMTEGIRIKIQPEPCKPGECSSQEIENRLFSLYESIKIISEESKEIIPFVNKNQWC